MDNSLGAIKHIVRGDVNHPNSSTRTPSGQISDDSYVQLFRFRRILICNVGSSLRCTMNQPIRSFRLVRLEEFIYSGGGEEVERSVWWER